jgi:hypothetical protein
VCLVCFVVKKFYDVEIENQFSEIDLVTLTREDILKKEYPVRSIVESMQAGMLQDIPEAMVLDKKI